MSQRCKAPSLPSDSTSAVDKDAAILRLLAHIDELCARVKKLETVNAALENSALRTRVADLEAKLELPPKTPDNSSTPPSHGRKASGEETKKPEGERRKAHGRRGATLQRTPASTADRRVGPAAVRL